MLPPGLSILGSLLQVAFRTDTFSKYRSLWALVHLQGCAAVTTLE